MSWSTAALSLLSGLLVAVLTTPVGVSGAVFLLPIRLSVLGVPSPSVTPTNLLSRLPQGSGDPAYRSDACPSAADGLVFRKTTT